MCPSTLAPPCLVPASSHATSHRTVLCCVLCRKKQHKFMYPLLSDPSLETLAALGATNGSRDAVLRSHIIIEKGGRVSERGARERCE